VDLARNRIDSLSRPPISGPGSTEAVVSGSPATVTFYRPRGFTGWGFATSITSKGRELAHLENGDYFTTTLAPGVHAIVGETGNWSGQRVFDLEPGQTYYIKIEHSIGMVELRASKPEEATAAIRSITPSKQTSAGK
jgi:hypothetical protein